MYRICAWNLLTLQGQIRFTIPTGSHSNGSCGGAHCCTVGKFESFVTDFMRLSRACLGKFIAFTGKRSKHQPFLAGLRELRVGGALGAATQQPARFDSGTHHYTAMVPAAAREVEVTATGFGLSPDSPIEQTLSVSLDGSAARELRSGVPTLLPLPNAGSEASLSVQVSSRIGQPSVLLRTNYTVEVRRASQIATVTGTGFEMHTALPQGADGGDDERAQSGHGNTGHRYYGS